MVLHTRCFSVCRSQSTILPDTLAIYTETKTRENIQSLGKSDMQPIFIENFSR